MKIFLTVMLSLAYKSAITQSDCSKLPTASQLLVTLSIKPVNISPLLIKTDCNVNDSVRLKLVYLLRNPKWTNREIDSVLSLGNVEQFKNWFNYKEKVENLSKGIDSLKKYAVDSIDKLVRSERIKLLEQEHYFDVNPQLIRTVATLNYKEAIPILKDALTNKNRLYDSATVILALAKLGDKESQNKIFTYCRPSKNISEFVWVDEFYQKASLLKFLASQESIYQFSFWMDTTYKYSYTEKTNGKSAYLVIGYLSHLIDNQGFPKENRNSKFDFTGLVGNNKEILYWQKWIRKNKGKYIINKN